LKPFLAFRSVHTLSKANLYANTKVHSINNGIKTKLYDGYPFLFMQTSKKNEYFPAPDWFYNVEYQEEQKRGYDFQEDLFMPGFFEMTIKKGESIVFAAGLEETQTQNLNKVFEDEIEKRIPRNNFENCLENAATQFMVRKDNKTYIIAGFPWFGPWGRDTFISLPGLTLTSKDIETCESVLDTMTNESQGALFKNMGTSDDADVNSVDAPLWYFWTIQQYVKCSGKTEQAWKNYGKKMKTILEGYKTGLKYNIKMHDNFLIWAGEEGKALTWMDAIVNGVPVTPRIGYAVEINALWYNAIMFTLELAKLFNDKKFIKEWEGIAEQIPANFTKLFYNEEKKQLADYVDNEGQKLAVRPNQVFATSLPYSPVNDDIKNEILEIVKSHLLTPRGLRSLSPKNKEYKGVYEGNQQQRDSAYHQGTVWPWLLGHYVEGSLKLYGKTFLSEAKKLYSGFQEELTNHGIGTISEIFDGDPPHVARGAISQAWSVAELLRIKLLIQEYEK
jgi:predicted glycogen debranching enzyme